MEKRLLREVLAANIAGRAKVIVREDTTKNGSWACARLRERFGRDSGATSFKEVFHHSWPRKKPFEDVWRECVKKVSKLPQGSLGSQAIGQLTISGLSRHGQPELENPSEVTSTDGMTRRPDTGRKMSVHHLPSTVTTTNGHQLCDDGFEMPEHRKPDTLEKGLLVQKTKPARTTENKDTWQLRVEVAMRSRNEAVARRARAKAHQKSSRKGKAKDK